MARCVGGERWEVSERIVTEVAAVEGVDPVDLPPLYSTVDPEALERLSTSASDDTPVRVEFPYAGVDLLIEYSDDVTVTVRPTGID
jgi:hypothetical protein